MEAVKNFQFTNSKSDCDIEVVVGAVIVNTAGEIFLATGHKWKGWFTIPGGHLEIDETIEQCAARELREETGLIAQPSDIKVTTLASTKSSGDQHHIQIGTQVKKYQGKPKVGEPEKCSDVNFWPLDALPTKIFQASGPLIEKYKEGVFY